MTRIRGLDEIRRAEWLRKYIVDYNTGTHADLRALYPQRTGNLRCQVRAPTIRPAKENANKKQRELNRLIAPLLYVDYIAKYPSRFLDLPGETRNAIYELALPYNEDSCPTKHRTALLRVCRQIYQEGRPIFHLLGSMTVKVSAHRDNYVQPDPLTFRWTLEGDVQLQEIMTHDLYKCKRLEILKNVRNLTIVTVESTHLGPEAWFSFFTYFAQATCRPRRLRVQQRSSDEWWYKDPDTAAMVLSPLKNCIPYGCLVYLEGFVPSSYEAVNKELGLQSVNDAGVKLFKVWNAMLSKHESVPRHCLSSE